MRDEFAGHVRQHVEPVTRRLQVADQGFGSRNRLLQVDGLLQHLGTARIRPARHLHKGLGHLLQRIRAPVVLLPEARHLRGTQKSEKTPTTPDRTSACHGRKELRPDRKRYSSWSHFFTAAKMRHRRRRSKFSRTFQPPDAKKTGRSPQEPSRCILSGHRLPAPPVRRGARQPSDPP